jgi:hypothetical protein
MIPAAGILIRAAPLVRFLERDSFFDTPCNGTAEDVMVVTDVDVAFHFAAAQTDEFEAWSEGDLDMVEYPPDFDFDCGSLTRRLDRKTTFTRDIETKNSNGVYEKWIKAADGLSCQVIEIMLRDMDMLFTCYANNHFPPFWEKMLDVYLRNGFPCGWSSRYPDGKLVVFSNAAGG